MKDMLTAEPIIVSRNVGEYAVFVYGEKKVGKTELASRFPQAWFLGFEKGFDKIPGTYGDNVGTWEEAKNYLYMQMSRKEVQERFNTIIIDTADLAWEFCKKYTCEQNKVNELSEIPHGGGWDKAAREFRNFLVTIYNRYGYGLVILSHCQTKTFEPKNLPRYDKIVPTLQDRAYQIINALVDINIYAAQRIENGVAIPTAYYRTNGTFEAGGRVKYMAPNFDLKYESLVEELNKAIDLHEQERGCKFSTEKLNRNTIKTPEQIGTAEFNEYKSRSVNIVNMLYTKFKDDKKTSFSNYWMPIIQQIITNHLGEGVSLQDATFDLRSQVCAVCDELTALTSGAIM